MKLYMNSSHGIKSRPGRASQVQYTEWTYPMVAWYVVCTHYTVYIAMRSGVLEVGNLRDALFKKKLAKSWHCPFMGGGVGHLQEFFGYVISKMKDIDQPLLIFKFNKNPHFIPLLPSIPPPQSLITSPSCPQYLPLMPSIPPPHTLITSPSKSYNFWPLKDKSDSGTW